MIEVTSFRDEKVAVLGLARSGLVAAQALQRGGARVMAWDDAPAKREAAVSSSVPVVDLVSSDWRGVKALVLSPGIPHTHPAPHPVAARARAAGAEIIGDIELLARTCRSARYVGITGTNGKSTTTALIGHILTEAGQRVQVGGNLGIPALSLAPMGSDGIYVLEMSSYQLELTPSLTFDVAVLLNITPDHLDRHGGMAGYVAAKRRIFDRQRNPQMAVVGDDDDICSDIASDMISRGSPASGRQIVRRISGRDPVPAGVYNLRDHLHDEWDESRGEKPLLALGKLQHLPGRHNWQNVAAAVAVARHFRVDTATIVAALKSFPGLAHRQELIATIDGVRYINDSKATNADASAKALACYDDIYWIAGGLAKEGGISSLAPFFPRIRHAFLIGKATEEFAATLDGHVPFTRCGDLAKALQAARERARAEHQANAVVLLSPACASFDQFANFEDRGEAFRHLVKALPGARA
jgi:UDP-N-acetylmuramoylalanine--D-glutamate ligase